MGLLKYEFMESPDGSINELKGEFVKKVRYYTSKVPMEDFHAAMPELLEIEKSLQNFDEEIGLERRDYLHEVMDELNAESNVESELLEDIQYATKAIFNGLNVFGVSIDDFSFEVNWSEAVHWVEFNGYNQDGGTEQTLLIMKDILKSICYKHGVIFLDKTLN